MWFPTGGLSNGFITFMKILQFKNATDLLQNILNGYSNFTKDLLIPLVIVLFYTILVYAFAIFAF